MKSRRTKEFREIYSKLPHDVKKQAVKSYRLFKKDPWHPSLHFKPIDRKNNLWSTRVNDDYRAVGVREGDTIIWFFIGTHANYERLY